MLQGIAMMMTSQSGTVVAAGITQVQFKSYASTSSINVHTFSPTSTPTSGNVIIIGVVSDNTVNTPSGWTLIQSAVSTTGTYMYYKVSNGTESSISVTLSGSATDSCAIGFMEYSGLTTVDKSAQNIGTGNTLATGTTATTTAANELIVTMVGTTNGTGTLGAVSSWTNGLTILLGTQTTGSGVNSRIDMAVLIVSSIAAYTSTATLASVNTNASAIIATFK